MDAQHWVLLGLTIPMATAFGFMMPKKSANRGPVFAMAYFAAMIFVFTSLEHIFDHRSAVFAAIACGSLDVIVILPTALLVVGYVDERECRGVAGERKPRGEVLKYLSGWRGLILLLLFTPAMMFLLAAFWSIAHGLPP